MSKLRPRAYSYVRMSTRQQLQGSSLTRQADAAAEYCLAHGFELVDTLEDIGLSAFSGQNLEKGALGEFVRAIDLELIEPESVLLIESFDRLSRREVLEAFDIFSKILRAGVKVVTLDTGVEYSKEALSHDFGRLIVSLALMHRANDESEIKSKRLKSSWKRKRQQSGSQKLTSIAPAWLQLNEERTDFLIIEDKAETVRKIFELCIQGYGSGAITGFLNRHISSFPPISARRRSGKHRWHKSYVQKILKNPAVHGEFQAHVMMERKRVPDGEPLPSYFPSIVSKERFLLAQIKLRSRSIAGSGRKGAIFSNLFTRLAQCGECGGTIGYRDKGQRRGGQFLRCTNADAGFECRAPAWKYQAFEESFLKWIVELNLAEVLNPGNLEEKRTKLINRLSALEQELDDSRSIYDNMRARLGLVPEPAVGDVIIDITESKLKIDRLEKEKMAVESELSANAPSKLSETHSRILVEIDRLQLTLSDEQKKDLRTRLHGSIRSIVEAIIVYPRGRAQPIIESVVSSDTDINNLGEQPGASLEEEATLRKARQMLSAQRTFTVRFKNQTQRVVSPDRGTNFKIMPAGHLDQAFSVHDPDT